MGIGAAGSGALRYGRAGTGCVKTAAGRRLQVNTFHSHNRLSYYHYSVNIPRQADCHGAGAVGAVSRQEAGGDLIYIADKTGE